MKSIRACARWRKFYFYASVVYTEIKRYALLINAGHLSRNDNSFNKGQAWIYVIMISTSKANFFTKPIFSFVIFRKPVNWENKDKFLLILLNPFNSLTEATINRI